MRKILLVLMIVLLCLTGCDRVTEPPLANGDYDTAGEKTVIYHGDHTFPLSYTVDGQQQIAPGTYWYYELADSYNKSWGDSFYTYDTKSLELNGNKEYSKLGKGNCYATNGDWPLFLSPVHTEYTLSNQELIEGGLIGLAQQPLDQQKIQQTVQITDVWSCDLDGDGQSETFFKACNCDTAAETDPHYCFLAYEKEGACQILCSSFRAEGESSAKEIRPMVCDLEGDGKWELAVHQKGDYESFALFDYTDGSFIQTYNILF